MVYSGILFKLVLKEQHSGFGETGAWHGVLDPLCRAAHHHSWLTPQCSLVLGALGTQRWERYNPWFWSQTKGSGRWKGGWPMWGWVRGEELGWKSREENWPGERPSCALETLRASENAPREKFCGRYSRIGWCHLDSQLRPLSWEEASTSLRGGRAEKEGVCITCSQKQDRSFLWFLAVVSEVDRCRGPGTL